MSEPTPMIDVRRNSPTPARCWAVSAVLALGLPAAIWIVSKLLSWCLPGMAHGSAEQRFLLWISGPALVEWLFVLLVWLLLRARESSFAAIGVWRFGTWPGWLMALLFGALSIASNLRFLPMLHIPISQAFWPHSTFHLLTASLVSSSFAWPLTHSQLTLCIRCNLSVSCHNSRFLTRVQSLGFQL